MEHKHLWADTRTSREMYEGLVAGLRKHRPVAYSRWGNGEFNCIFGQRGRNASGHSYFPDLGIRLNNVLASRPDYALGLQRLAVLQRGELIATRYADIPWTSAEFLHDVSAKDGIDELFLALNGLDVILVGPDYIQSLTAIFPFQHVPIPIRDCWLEHDRVLEDIFEALDDRAPEKFTVVLFVASMMTGVLVDELYREFPGRKVSLIDIGSVFDPYAGRRTRKYHRRMIPASNVRATA